MENDNKKLQELERELQCLKETAEEDRQTIFNICGKLRELKESAQSILEEIEYIEETLNVLG